MCVSSRVLLPSLSPSRHRRPRSLFVIYLYFSLPFFTHILAFVSLVFCTAAAPLLQTPLLQCHVVRKCRRTGRQRRASEEESSIVCTRLLRTLIGWIRKMDAIRLMTNVVSHLRALPSPHCMPYVQVKKIEAMIIAKQRAQASCKQIV